MEKHRYKSIERVFKGVASHRRVQILDVLGKNPELSVMELAEHLSADYRTLSEHIRKMELAGLVMKRHKGVAVLHSLTNRGKDVLKFSRTLE